MRRMTITLCLVSLMLTTSIFAREESSLLPEASAVEAIIIKFDHRDYKEDVEFTATVEDWKAIRKGLLPAREDPNPALWEWFGSVTIVQKDRKQHQIELYQVSGKKPGAFALAKSPTERDYYRGGKSPDVMKAVYAAYEKYLEDLE